MLQQTRFSSILATKMCDIAVKTAAVVLAVCMCGCTIGRLHMSLVDLNKADASACEDAPPKPAAQLNFQWDF